MPPRKIDLQNEHNAIIMRMHAINDAAEAEGRDLTAEEQENWEKAGTELIALKKRIERADYLETMPVRDEEQRVWDLNRDREAGPPQTAEEAMKRENRAYDAAFRDYMTASRTNLVPRESMEILYRGKSTLSETDRAQLDSQLKASLSPSQYRAAMGTSVQTGGGFWIPEGMMQRVEKALLWFGGMRRFAGSGVFATDDGADLPWPVYDDTSNSGRRLAENTAATQTDIAVGLRVLKAYTYTSDEVLISQQLLQDRPDLAEGIIADALGERIARAQNLEFTTYTGGDGPTGLIRSTTAGVTAAATGAVTADELLNLKYSVNRAYRERPDCAFMMADATYLEVMKLKDGEGDYYFLSPINGAEPPVWNSPVIPNNDMPSMATGNISIVYGDGGSFKIRDVRGLTLLRMEERYAPVLQVSFLGFARADAGLIDAGQHPIKHLVHP